MKIFSPEKTVPRLPTGAQALDPAGDSNLQLQLQVCRSAPPKTNFWLRLCNAPTHLDLDQRSGCSSGRSWSLERDTTRRQPFLRRMALDDDDLDFQSEEECGCCKCVGNFCVVKTAKTFVGVAKSIRWKWSFSAGRGSRILWFYSQCSSTEPSVCLCVCLSVAVRCHSQATADQTVGQRGGSHPAFSTDRLPEYENQCVDALTRVTGVNRENFANVCS